MFCDIFAIKLSPVIYLPAGHLSLTVVSSRAGMLWAFGETRQTDLRAASSSVFLTDDEGLLPVRLFSAHPLQRDSWKKRQLKKFYKSTTLKRFQKVAVQIGLFEVFEWFFFAIVMQQRRGTWSCTAQHDVWSEKTTRWRDCIHTGGDQ